LSRAEGLNHRDAQQPTVIPESLNQPQAAPEVVPD